MFINILCLYINVKGLCYYTLCAIETRSYTYANRNMGGFKTMEMGIKLVEKIMKIDYSILRFDLD